MPLMPWDASLSVGVESIDDQHKVLVNTLNELHDAMMNGSGREKTGLILETLVAYTRDHFRQEEELMAAAGYPGLQNHRRLHADLVKQVETYIARFQRGQQTLTLHLLRFLRDWLMHHILEVDKEYAPYMAQEPARSDFK